MADFKLFTGDFKLAFDQLVGKAPEDFKRGLFNAAAELLRDSNNVEPKTPKKEGTLKGSWQVEAAYTSPDQWELTCGFNAQYASYLHEAADLPMVMEHWSEPGSGPKYLESKLTMFGSKYIDIAYKSMVGEQ